MKPKIWPVLILMVFFPSVLLGGIKIGSSTEEPFVGDTAAAPYNLGPGITGYNWT